MLSQRCGTGLRLSHQKGVVLIVGLIMVLLISIVALASIKGSGLQEAMAGNMRDRGAAFQASEGGLSEGENTILTSGIVCNGAAQNGLVCWRDLDTTAAGPAGSVQYFNAASFTQFGNTTALALGSDAPPVYVLEELDTFVPPNEGNALDEQKNNLGKLTAYRVTARGVGKTANSQVVIQSTYTQPAN